MLKKMGSLFVISWALSVGVAGYARAQSISVQGPPAAATEAIGESTATDTQRAYLKASLQERVGIAEKIGDEGARRFATEKGWKPVFDGAGRTMSQGPDQVYQGVDGILHVVEAKGGSSPLSRAYGYQQGTSEWAVESAKNVLRSNQASPTEKAAANAMLEAAACGKMEVQVVRTKHILGEPTVAVLESVSATSEDAASLARSALAKMSRATPTRVSGSVGADVFERRSEPDGRCREDRKASPRGPHCIKVPLGGWRGC